MQKSITWTKGLQDAVEWIADEPAPPASPSVRERAREAADFCRPGMVLEPWHVEIIQCLRTRLETYAYDSHRAFEVEFGKAWESAS